MSERDLHCPLRDGESLREQGSQIETLASVQTRTEILHARYRTVAVDAEVAIEEFMHRRLY